MTRSFWQARTTAIRVPRTPISKPAPNVSCGVSERTEGPRYPESVRYLLEKSHEKQKNIRRVRSWSQLLIRAPLQSNLPAVWSTPVPDYYRTASEPAFRSGLRLLPGAAQSNRRSRLESRMDGRWLASLCQLGLILLGSIRWCRSHFRICVPMQVAMQSTELVLA